MDDSIEVNGERLTDTLKSVIKSKMRDKGFSGHLTASEEAYTRWAYEHPFHPVRDYLNGLTWGGGDYISQLAVYIRDKHKNRVFPLYLRKFLIGAVAKAYTGAQNPMLTLEGAQDLGKSYLVSRRRAKQTSGPTSHHPTPSLPTL